MEKSESIYVATQSKIAHRVRHWMKTLKTLATPTKAIVASERETEAKPMGSMTVLLGSRDAITVETSISISQASDYQLHSEIWVKTQPRRRSSTI